MCCLGLMYRYGRGVEMDYGEAIDWLNAAATRNHMGAQYLLAQLYEECEQYALADEYYRMAAENGDEDAINKLNDKKFQKLVRKASK